MKKKERFKRFKKLTKKYVREVYADCCVYPTVIQTDEEMEFEGETGTIGVVIWYDAASQSFYGNFKEDFVPGCMDVEFSHLRRNYCFCGSNYKMLKKCFEAAVADYRRDLQTINEICEDTLLAIDYIALFLNEVKNPDTCKEKIILKAVPLNEPDTSALIELRTGKVVFSDMKNEDLSRAFSVIEFHVPFLYALIKDCESDEIAAGKVSKSTTALENAEILWNTLLLADNFYFIYDEDESKGSQSIIQVMAIADTTKKALIDLDTCEPVGSTIFNDSVDEMVEAVRKHQEDLREALKRRLECPVSCDDCRKGAENTSSSSSDSDE